ncbi:M20/M25/M40 family metallo-hydrolase [Longivirga aurantiaca]|uniref:M20/M25/M40 family metallo-hydrolase n=1 Tax=Longivirga aurantiaca TaxID=1837743 RepID=A0ABW1T1V3_9ACTN
MAATPIDEFVTLYEDLHRNPELRFQETRTAGIVADRLRALGYDVTTGVGRTGVVGVLSNGDGPTVMLRADMDALPVEEKTGLPYASSVRAVGEDGTEVPVMHACGHDVHVTCLLAALERIVRGEAAAAGAPSEPEIIPVMSAPAVVNDPDAVARTSAVLASVAMVVDPGVVTGSEDVGMFATAAGAPCVYWLLGGADPALSTAPPLSEESMAQLRSVPSNHSPMYAPAPVPTLAIGRDALVAAAQEWLAP